MACWRPIGPARLYLALLGPHRSIVSLGSISRFCEILQLGLIPQLLHLDLVLKVAVFEEEEEEEE